MSTYKQLPQPQECNGAIEDAADIMCHACCFMQELAPEVMLYLLTIAWASRMHDAINSAVGIT